MPLDNSPDTDAEADIEEDFSMNEPYEGRNEPNIEQISIEHLNSETSSDEENMKQFTTSDRRNIDKVTEQPIKWGQKDVTFSLPDYHLPNGIKGDPFVVANCPNRLLYNFIGFFD